MTLIEYVCQDVLNVIRFGVLIRYKVRRRSVLAEVGRNLFTETGICFQDQNTETGICFQVDIWKHETDKSVSRQES